MMRTFFPSLIVATALISAASPGQAEKRQKALPKATIAPGRTPMASLDPIAPPAPLVPTTNIAQGINALPDHATLGRLINSAQLTAALSASGPITVFAPNDEAFSRLAPGTVDTLLKPENIATLTAILKYHVVPGVMTVDAIKAKIAAGGGTATLPTLHGAPLTATLYNDIVTLTDQNGNKSYVSTPDVPESNGLIQVVNGVVIPKLG